MEFTSDEKKILFILSYLHGGLAGRWADNYVDVAMAHSPINFRTIKEFLMEIKRHFEKPDQKKDMLTKLNNSQQGKMTADKFWIEFDTLRCIAGLDKLLNEEYLIQLIELHMNKPLIDQIYSGATIPSTVEEWQT
jgi:Ty3 transposon capsid-like protein